MVYWLYLSKFNRRDLPIWSRFSKCFYCNIPQQFAENSEDWEASWYQILTGRIKEQDGLLIWLYLSKFDLARLTSLQQVQQMFLLEGLQMVLKIPKVVWHQILTGKTDRSESRKSNNESLIKVVRNKKNRNFFSHRYLIEFDETNRMSHVPHSYDIIILLK